MKRFLPAALVALSACDPQAATSADSGHTAQTTVRTEATLQTETHPADKPIDPATKTTWPRKTAPSASSMTPKERKINCFLAVDGKTQVDGDCLVYPMGDRGYTLNTWSKGKPQQSHFAVVSANSDGTATASWNADPNDNRASDPLGDVQWSSGCWINRRVRICSSE